jgi:hypothetical protein
MPTTFLSKTLSPLLPLLLAAVPLFSQNENQILDSDLQTVQLQAGGAGLTMPIVALGGGALVLQFDHAGDEIRDYLYTIVHCDSDWKPSDLQENEYIDGFTEDRITDFQNSFNTLSQYVHYTLTLPNRNMKWSKSGNYLLKVFDNTDEKTLVLVRRFCVVEQSWRIDAHFVRPVALSKMDTHHEIDFTVNYGSARITNPQNDVKAFVLQNGNWFDAIGPLPPYLSRGEQLIYDYQGRIVFPAKKDWRLFDIRTFELRGENVKNIETRPDHYEVTLKPDKSRAGLSAVYRGDINGRFAIENQNLNQSFLQCDYATVLFSVLQNLPFEDDDVYVFGELSDWQLKPEFKMEYSHEAKAYVCEAWLKQGLYNYEYRVVNRSTGKSDEEGLEGNWYETPNKYTILTYFRPFGARFDRLMGAATIDSRTRQ